MKKLLRRVLPKPAIKLYHTLNALLANLYYGFPGKHLKVIAITGTDGKTTTATLIYTILKEAGIKVALITTVAAYIGRKKLETGLHVTTPDPWELQRLLKLIVSNGYDYLVLEVTSHGIDQNRILGIKPTFAVLTNVNHEHLDYHRTYNNYLNSKAKLFTITKTAILNRSDKSFTLVKNQLPGSVKIVPYNATSIKGDMGLAIKGRFVEKYNQENASAAATVAHLLNLDETKVAKAISTFVGVPGRLQNIPNNKGINLYIDFAHTPNALKQVLLSLSKFKKPGSRLISVFGCASERDDNKRAIMAKNSTKIADISVFTAEDPRREDINKIIEQMATGVNKKRTDEISLDSVYVDSTLDTTQKHYFVRVPERGEAIFIAINKLARIDDTVVICGKGHEKSMSYFGVEHPWSDLAAVKKALAGKVKKIKHG